MKSMSRYEFDLSNKKLIEINENRAPANQGPKMVDFQEEFNSKSMKIEARPARAPKWSLSNKNFLKINENQMLQSEGVTSRQHARTYITLCVLPVERFP